MSICSPNPDQVDSDGDGTGDACDTNDIAVFAAAFGSYDCGGECGPADYDKENDVDGSDLAVFVAVMDEGEPNEELIWHEYNGHEYALTSDWGNWDQAEAEAVVHGGHLVSINDATENEWVTSTFASTYTRSNNGNAAHALVWIGLQGSSVSSVQWISGEPVTYTNFSAYFPYQGGSNHFMAVAGHPEPGKWNSNPLHYDDPCSQPKGVIERPLTSVSLQFNMLPSAMAELMF